MTEWRERLSALARQAIDQARRLPRPTPVQWLKALPFIVVALAFVVIVGRNLDTVDFPDYAAPEGFVAAPPPSTLPPGFQRPSLAPVAGETTTTVPANVGTSRLSGSVLGPQGAVPGAIVRIERTISGQVQTLDLLTDGAGNWDAPGIGGGRYRVRAFLPPTLAQRTAEVFYLRAGDERRVDLTVEAFSQPGVALAAAPAPALLDQQVNVGVLVTNRSVDGNGFVAARPLAGAVVQVSSSSAWDRVSSEGSFVTDANGQVVVTFICRDVGSVSVQAVVQLGAGTPSLVGSATFDCVDPATLTTTTQPAVAGPGNDSTTSTSTTSTTQP